MAFAAVRFCACVLVVITARAGLGEEPAQLPLVPPADLVVGDYCVVNVARGGVHEQCEGGVVKVTDRWLVLGKRIRMSGEEETSVLSKVPLVGRYFRTRVSDESHLYICIPIEAATVVERTTPAWQAPDIPNFDAPPPDAAGRVCYVTADGAASIHDGKTGTISAQELTYLDHRETKPHQIPLEKMLYVAFQHGEWRRIPKPSP